MASFKVRDLDDNKEGEFEACDPATAAEVFAEHGWRGDEEETRRVQVQQAGQERRETFLVHVHMVPHFRATREEHS